MTCGWRHMVKACRRSAPSRVCAERLCAANAANESGTDDRCRLATAEPQLSYSSDWFLPSLEIVRTLHREFASTSSQFPRVIVEISYARRESRLRTRCARRERWNN